MSSVSVVVPTYWRAGSLASCLAGVRAQSRRPDEVIVVRHVDDRAAARVVGESALPGVREVIADASGVVAALRAGFAAAQGDIVAVTDDDAVPRPDWLARLLGLFGDATVGVVGGRDILRSAAQTGPPTADVGRVGRWGRLVGNHHLGIGGVREVDVVKGVNLAVRRSACALPDDLRGRGAQPHWEVALCRWARSRGWRVLYDPDLLVDHHPAERVAGDSRDRRAAEDVAAEAYNLVAALLVEHPELRVRRAAYGVVVGDGAVPGLARAMRSVAAGDREGVRRLAPSLRGQLVALRRARRGGGLAMRPIDVEPPPLRVVLVAHDVHDGGGMERVLAQLIRCAGRDVAFSVVSTSLAPDLAGCVRWVRVRVPGRPFPLRFLAFYVVAGLRLRRLHGHLVHTCGALVPNHVDLASVHFCHAGFVSATGRFAPPAGSHLRRVNTSLTRRLSVLAERWTYRPQRTPRLAAVSAGVERELQRHYPGVPVSVTSNGVDTRRFTPDAGMRSRLRAEAGAEESDVIALFVGGDWPRKGVATAIEAVGLARVRTAARLRLWVVGPGDQDRYRSVAQEAGVAGLIHFFGPRSDTERFYAAADCLVLPTLYEAYSLVALEAAAAGLPLVVTRVNGAEELVGADQAGILVDRTPSSFAAAFVRLADDPALRDRLGRQARRRVAGLTWEASAREVLRLYRELQSAPGALVGAGHGG